MFSKRNPVAAKAKADAKAKARERRQPAAGRKPGKDGFAGPGGGRHPWVEAPAEYRGTTVQTCGLWPFGTGSQVPTVGVPLGRHLYSGATVCFDPVNWFTRTSLISTPNVFIESEPGMGKSSGVRRIVTGLSAQGVIPLILGDLKPDYANLVEALGGQVLRVGPGQHKINPLDAGPWRELLSKVDAADAKRVRATVVDRRTNIIVALCTLARRGPVDATETAVLTAVMRHLTDTETDKAQPILADILDVIQEGPDAVRAVTLWNDEADHDKYLNELSNLRRTLLSLVHGPLGESFNGQTTAKIDLSTSAVCVDISAIDETDELRTAATLLTTWSWGFATVDAAHLAADLGLAPQRQFVVILDELWRALRVGHGLVDRADALTRLSRSKGTAIIYITHSLSDLQALEREEDRAKARGFAERASVLMIGASSPQELEELSKVRPLSDAEKREIGSWTAPPSWDTTGRSVPVGRGNFLIKVGSRPGIPIHLELTDIEMELGNTDSRWTTSNRDGLAGARS